MNETPYTAGQVFKLPPGQVLQLWYNHGNKTEYTHNGPGATISPEFYLPTNDINVLFTLVWQLCQEFLRLSELSLVTVVPFKVFR